MSNLNTDEKHLVEQVVARRRPELRERVAVIGQKKLNRMGRQAFHDALNEEWIAAAAEDEGSGEQAEYVRTIKNLVDRSLSSKGLMDRYHWKNFLTVTS